MSGIKCLMHNPQSERALTSKRALPTLVRLSLLAVVPNPRAITSDPATSSRLPGLKLPPPRPSESQPPQTSPPSSCPPRPSRPLFLLNTRIPLLSRGAPLLPPPPVRLAPQPLESSPLPRVLGRSLLLAPSGEKLPLVLKDGQRRRPCCCCRPGRSIGRRLTGRRRCLWAILR